MLFIQHIKRIFTLKNILITFGVIFLVIVGIEVQDTMRQSGYFRTMQDPISSKETVNLKGLRELQIAGGPPISFSDLKEKMPSKNIIVVGGLYDKHGYINGIPATYLSYNGGVSLKHYFWRLIYTHTLKAHPELTIPEEQEAKNHGLKYVYFVIGSKVNNSPQVIDKFIHFLDTLAPDTWVYYHCRHGKGRTSIMLVLADIFANAPEVSLQDIVKRQYLLGSEDLFNTTPWAKGTYGKAMLENRKQFISDFYEFICQRKAGGEQTWSTWIENKPDTSWKNS